MMISTILFDLDGVIIDSNPTIVEAWKKVAEKYDVQITNYDISNSILGVTGHYTLNKIFGHFDKKIQNEIHKQVDIIEESARYELLPGFKEFYHSLLDTNLKLGVVTSSWRKKILNVFDQHSLIGFFCVITRDDVLLSKPNPAPYTKAINFWNESPSNVLIFEDSSNGIKSALASGANCIAVNNRILNIDSIDDFRQIRVKNNSILTPKESYQIK